MVLLKIKDRVCVINVEYVFKNYLFPTLHNSIKMRHWYRKQLAVNRVVLILEYTLESAEELLKSTNAYLEGSMSGVSRTLAMLSLPEWW